MTKDEFLAQVKGRTIVEVEGEPDPRCPASNDFVLWGLRLDDGSRIFLSGSDQIGIDDVWAGIDDGR